MVTFLTQLTRDLESMMQSRWRWFVIVILAFVHCLSLKGLVKERHLPIKTNLLIGQNLVGRISPEVDAGIPLLSPWGYDSQFFWALSLDPLLRNNEIKNSIDAPPYRSQRILLPLLTWSAIRDPAKIIYGLWFWNLIGYILGLIGVYKICLHFNISYVIPLLFYAFNSGILISLVHPMSDILASGLFFFALSFWLKNKKIAAMILFSLACLAREFIAVYIFFIALHQVLISKKLEFKFIMPLALSCLPMILWQIGIRLNLSGWSFNGSVGNFDWPFLGTIKAWIANWFDARSPKDVIGALCIHALSVLFIYKGYAKYKSLLWFLVSVSAALMCLSGKAIMESDWSYMRVSILLVTLMTMVIFIDIPSNGLPGHEHLTDKETSKTGLSTPGD